MTFVARSRIFGFPDAVTVEVRALPGGGSTLAIFSRQRFGSGDGGVNEARVKRWLRKLAP
jgi:uncharacterized protein (DUF1499 family)